MLVIRSVAAAVVFPGTVTVAIPWLILQGSGQHTPRWTGLALAAVGVAVLFRCIWEFAVSGRGTLAPIDPPTRLVVNGLYRYIRNPMYVGVVLILAGEAWLFWSVGLLLYAAGFFLVASLFIIFHEEPALRGEFGESYADYARTVPRWVPRVRGHLRQ
jgi:protein-S-isoprenylcysteine O-methyltransferase Ste14